MLAQAVEEMRSIDDDVVRLACAVLGQKIFKDRQRLILVSMIMEQVVGWWRRLSVPGTREAFNSGVLPLGVLLEPTGNCADEIEEGEWSRVGVRKPLFQQVQLGPEDLVIVQQFFSHTHRFLRKARSANVTITLVSCLLVFHDTDHPSPIRARPSPGCAKLLRADGANRVLSWSGRRMVILPREVASQCLRLNEAIVRIEVSHRVPAMRASS